MAMNVALRSKTFAVWFLGLTLLPGAWMFASAPMSGVGSNVMAGKAQRLYETRFEDSFPMRATLRHAWAAAKYATLGEMADGAILGSGGVLFTAEEFTAPNMPRDFLAELRTARSRIEEAGGTLLPVIVPDKSRMMADALPRARSPHFAARYDRKLQAINRAGLTTVDLRPALARFGSFMITDTHWSPKGAQAVAEAVAQIVAQDLDPDARFETLRLGPRDFEGDLVAFADTGFWRPWVGPVFEPIETFETRSLDAGELGLFDEVDTPVALVGTSFSAREDFHFVGFLKSALGADVVSFAMEGHGPFVPMDRFLNGDALASAPPKLVIWEIPERYLDIWSYDQ